MIRAKRASLHVRITVAYFLSSLAVSGFVAGATFGLARSYLLRQRVDAVVNQSYNSLRYATELLSGPRRQQSLEPLVSALQLRGAGDVLLVRGNDIVASSVTLNAKSVPAALRDHVSKGDVAYMRVRQGLIFGSPVPNNSLQAFFVYPLAELDATVRILARILLAAVAVAVGVAAFIGARLARLTVLPLRQASDAARRVAEGLIETRLEAEGTDELGAMAQSFNEMAAALQERMARERRFVGDASHELRTPLTALRTSIEYLVERSSDVPASLHAPMNVALQEALALQRLVDDLLELSVVEAGDVAPAWAELDLAAFVREVVRRRAPDGSVTVEAPGDTLVVRTDKARLERVVGNLVENACVHGGGGVLSLKAEDDSAVIEVRDRGPGVPEQQAERIFERFYRGGQSRSSKSGRTGAGLGLAIARESATIIGADISVETPPDGGAQFVVRLPLGTQ